MAHIGVLKVFQEHSLPIGCIAGTSAGALVGGAFAAGLSVEELERIGRQLRWGDMGRLTFSRLGIQSNERLGQFIRERFPVTRFEDLRIPFAAVATDLHSGTPVVMKGEGDIAFAIRASCAIPGWYVPVTDEQGRQLVDGGLVANVPASTARSLGADIVIAVDVNADGAKFLGPPQSVFGVLLQAMMVVQRNAARRQGQDADIIIRPKVGHIRWDEVSRAEELLAAGEEAARSTIETIKQLWASYRSSKWFNRRR
jgi:NTE family protein